MERRGRGQWPHMFIATLSLLFHCYQPPTVVAMQCNTTNIQVPAPELTHEALYEKQYVIVTWKANQDLQNFSAIYCCNRIADGYLNMCAYKCPNMKRIDDCTVQRSNTLELEYRCSFQSTEFVINDVFLTAKVNNCVVNSVKKSIITTLQTANPPQVTKLILSTTKEELIAQWEKSRVEYTVQYYLTWHEIGPEGRIRKLMPWINKTKETSVKIPMTSNIQPYTVYECCVQSCLTTNEKCKPRQVCNRTRTPEAAPSKQPEFLCGIDKDCSQVLRGNHRNVTLIWKLPAKVYWNGVPEKVMVEVYDSIGVKNRTTIHNLNGSSTQYMLTGLWTTHTYTIYVKMCTVAGCSTISTPIVLYPLTTQEQADVVQPFNFKIIAIFGTVIVFVIFLTLILCFLWETKRNTNRRPTGVLPSLQEPVTRDQTWSGGDSVATSIFVNPGDYDFLCSDHQQKEGATCYRGSLFDHDLNHLYENETTSMASLHGDYHNPLLRSSSVSSMDRQVLVTYLPQSMDMVSSLSSVSSDDESQQLL